MYLQVIDLLDLEATGSKKDIRNNTSAYFHK